MLTFTQHLVSVTSEREGERDIDVVVFHITTPCSLVGDRWKYLQYQKLRAMVSLPEVSLKVAWERQIISRSGFPSLLEVLKKL
jgi:hypothetical protein